MTSSIARWFRYYLFYKGPKVEPIRLSVSSFTLSAPQAISQDVPAQLATLSAAIAGHTESQVVPPVPETIEDTGLSYAFIEQLLLRTLYFRGELVGRDLAHAVGLKFSLIEPIIDALKRAQTVQMKRSAGMGNVSGFFSLTEMGRQVAREYLESTQYVGPAPVPLNQYASVVRPQRPEPGWLTPSNLKSAYSRMVVDPDIMEQIGPAVSSGNSFLIYGRPGNGKTFLAEALADLNPAPIYLPYAIEYQGAIIQIYDAIFHQVIEEQEEPSVLYVSAERTHDQRWFKCRRPFIVSGGELTLDMLDLTYNPASRIYDAPLQLKANNGIYLVDDFGRQRATPAEILNRWIVPMERRVDFLTLKTGGKMKLPFECFLVFSTNLRPDELGDEAFLRRIQYKMHLRNPTEREFLQIFWGFAAKNQLECSPGVVDEFLTRHYRGPGKRMRRCHPRDILSHALDLIHFESLSWELTPDLLDRAFRGCFAEVGDMEA